MNPKMPYERVDIKKLSFDKRNARKHDKKNIKSIKDSLLKFGQQKPLVVSSDGFVIAGNGTLQAAKELGWETIDVHWSALKGEEAIAYGLVDNRSAELADWDEDILKDLLGELDKSGWDLDGLGWDSEDLKDILPDEKSEGLTDEDAVPETTQNEMGVQRGDIWQLGNHRIMCGDSTSKENIEKLMNNEKVDMVFTDPPYGMNLDTDYSSMKTPNRIKHIVPTNSGKKQNKIIGDDKQFELQAWVLELSSEVILFGADYYAHTIPQNSGSWFVWDKRSQEESSQLAFGSCFELAWSKTKHKRELARIHWQGVFGVKDDLKTREHPSQKPVQLVEWFFERIKAESVIDLFLGSGSTLIACEKTNRKCYGMELDEHYCSVIIKRWQDFTGNKAVRLS